MMKGRKDEAMDEEDEVQKAGGQAKEALKLEKKNSSKSERSAAGEAEKQLSRKQKKVQSRMSIFDLKMKA